MLENKRAVSVRIDRENTGLSCTLVNVRQYCRVVKLSAVIEVSCDAVMFQFPDVAICARGNLVLYFLGKHFNLIFLVTCRFM